ncbi:ferredoxin reductase family protein [Phaeobacter sp. J2-8]|uniref:ferredoxin reductase family protein n=1 Tax=Phaeobacter sp. J2-8 TaxID=2931394 RepID=UPI001FD24666|nr:ferredoxin reductase family protein [Phaeobacter sp. J2-8]MCJ7871772.1 ferredoxin reductase family protein [Phaeobacter sp. J2-8]
MFYVLVFLFGVFFPSGLVVFAAGNASAQSVAALCAGASGYSLMAINLFLATRPRFLEPMIGGLDRIYKLHKWTGISIVAFILFHEGVGMDLEGQIVATGLTKTAVDVAEIVFPILLALILVSFFKRLPAAITRRVRFLNRDLIPYGLWRWTHRILGLLFIVLTGHQFFVKVPFDMNAMAAQYLNFMAVLGILSFLWTQLLAPYRRRPYDITKVEHHPAATIIEAKPRGRGVRPRPGAFAVISIKRMGLREPHPFTISGTGPKGEVQFSIRGLGDYTRRLRDLVKVGDKMTVEGGYGRFNYAKGEKEQLWVAGGIGITPFLAFADSLTADETRTIKLVYCVNKPEEVVGLDRFRAAEKRCPGFTLDLHISKSDGRLTAQVLADKVAFDLTQAGFWFCGPAPMRSALVSGLKTLGKSPRSVHFEEFEFR